MKARITVGLLVLQQIINIYMTNAFLVTKLKYNNNSDL